MEQDSNSRLPQEKPIEGEVLSKEVLSKAAEKGIFVNTLNIITSPAQTLLKPLKHHYHHHYHKRFPRHHRKIFIFDLALVAAILVLGAFAAYYFFQKPTFQPLEISLTAKGQKIIVGSEHTWELHMRNTSKKQLRAITTTLTFPESFLITAPSNADASSTTQTRVWKIDSSAAKENMSMELRGMLFSRAGEAVHIIARTEGLTDKQEPFSETNILTLQSSNPALATTVDIPPSALTGESFPFTIAYTNQSATPLTNSIVRFELPSSFILNNKPSAWQDNSIILPALAPGAHGTMELNGTLTADPRAPNVSIALHTSAEMQGRRINQEDVLSNISIKPIGVKMSLKSLETSGTPGAPLHLTLSLEHTGSENFQAVTLCVPLNLTIINKDSIKGGGKLTSEGYCFSPAELPELAKIKNGFRGEWPLTFTLQNSIVLTDSDSNKNAVLALRPYSMFNAPRTPPLKLSLIGPELRVPLTTTLTLQAMGRYFTNEGDQLGRGPLPPQIGKTTKYWIGWAIHSSANSIKNIVLRAVLPPAIQWSGKSTVNKGKNMIYDPVTHEVRWMHDILEPTAEGCACAEGGFEISFTPSPEDAGTVPALIKNISVDAEDVWTETRVHASASDITANLADDPFARGRGRVQK